MKVDIRLNNRIDVPTEGLSSRCVRALEKLFEHENPEFHKKRSMGYATHGIPAVIKTWKDREVNGVQYLSLPRGSVRLVLKTLVPLLPASVTVRDVQVLDERSNGDPSMFGKIPKSNVELYDYQRDAIDKAIKRENCLIRAPTGSGKTTAAIALIGEVDLPALVIVWSGNLFDQWMRRFQSEMGLKPKQIGVIRGASRRIKPVTIAMQQTLARNEKLLEEISGFFGLVLCDEVQRFAAPTLFTTVDPFEARYRIGISADESRKDKKEFLLYDLFGSAAADIDKQTLIDGGFIHEVRLRVVPTDFDGAWYRESGKTGEDYNRLMQQMADDPERNRLIIRTAVEEVQLGNQVLVLAGRREHCFALDQDINAHGIQSGVMIGGDEHSNIFAETRDRLVKGKIRAAVGTVQAIGQGTDLPSVSRGILAFPMASNRQQMGQVAGRVCRTSEATGKTDACLYYLLDRLTFPNALKNLCSWFKTVEMRKEDGSWQRL